MHILGESASLYTYPGSGDAPWHLLPFCLTQGPGDPNTPVKLSATGRLLAKSPIMTSFLAGGGASFSSKTLRVMGPLSFLSFRG